jgi:hypothetical protein
MRIYELTYAKFRRLRRGGIMVCQKCGFLLRVGDVIITRKKDKHGSKNFHHITCYTDASGQPIF